MRSITIVAAAAILGLMACDGTGIELTSGDAAEDRRHDPDVPYDSPWEPPYDPPYEPPRDPPWPDPIDDPCTGLTAPIGGICNIVEQCGCMPGFACDFQVDPATCMVIEGCVGGSGTLDVEEECTGPECRPGTSCLFDGGEPFGRCREWCVDSSDCSLPGRECSVEIAFTLPDPCSGTGSVPYQVCSLVCPPSADCDLFATGSDPTGCPYGQACARDIPIAAGGCDINICIPEGIRDEGEDCGSGFGCLRGMGCYGNETDGYHCWYYCDDIHACTTGTCTMIGAESMPDLGICMP